MDSKPTYQELEEQIAQLKRQLLPKKNQEQQDIISNKSIDIIQNERNKYKELFEHSPVAILEEDLSGPYSAFLNSNKKGLDKFISSFEKNPETIFDIISKIVVTNVNQAAVELLQAKSKKHLIANINQAFTPATLKHFLNVLQTIKDQKTVLVDEIEMLSFKQKPIHGLIKVNFQYQNQAPFLLARISIIDITKRVETDAKLRESEEKFKRLSNLSFESILIHDQGIIKEVNNTFCELSGYSVEELIGQNIVSLAVVEKYHSMVNEKIKTEYAGSFELEVLTKKGVVLNVEIESKALQSNKYPNLRVVAIRDITGRKKAFHENKKLTTAVAQSSNTIVITDTKGDITYVNPQFTKDTGYSEKEVLGNNPRILNSGKQSKHYYKSMWKAITSGNSWEGEFQNKSKSGEIFWENVNITPIKDESGEIVNYLAIKDNITQRKNAEEQITQSRSKLLESEKKFRSLFEKSVDAAVIIKNGIIRECNQASIELLELSSREGILNLHLSKVSTLSTSGEKESFDQVESILKACLKEGSHRYEWVYTKDNGDEVPIEVSLTTILNKPGKQIIHGIWRNMTSIKNTEKKLINQNSKLKILSNTVSFKNQLLTEGKYRYQNLIAQNPVSLWEENFKKVKELVDQKVKETSDLKTYLDSNPEFVNKCIEAVEILSVNTATLKLFGAKNKLELYKHLQSTFNENSRAVFKGEILALASGVRQFETETEYIKTDGSIIYTILKLVVIDDQHNAIVSIVDITDIKKAEQLVIESHEKLTVQKEKAEESNRLKTEFLNNMSHEIRTPMNGILGFTQFLEDNDLSAEKRSHYVNIIENSGNQLLQVIDDILEISKLGTKQVKVIESKVNLNSLLLELFAIFDIKAKENQTPLYFIKGMKDKESTIYTDKTKLNKILSNLIENALKFTSEGFIEFGYKRKGDEIVIYVKDTGIGISKHKFNLIFERFSQAEKGLSRKVGGLGLGLSIAKENSILLGGDISVESTLNEGTTFFVTIPYKPVFKPQKVNKLTPPKPIDANAYTILIAEDEEINYLYLEILLGGNQNFKFNILHAKNGKEALTACNQNSDIDLVLMDLKMPIMDGFEATRLIKESHPELPIIAQTAYSTNKEKEVAITAGCDDFISKPIVKEEFNTLINKFISQL
jgi:PAS domain S-box-containing protein